MSKSNLHSDVAKPPQKRVAAAARCHSDESLADGALQEKRSQEVPRGRALPVAAGAVCLLLVLASALLLRSINDLNRQVNETADRNAALLAAALDRLASGVQEEAVATRAAIDAIETADVNVESVAEAVAAATSNAVSTSFASLSVEPVIDTRRLAAVIAESTRRAVAGVNVTNHVDVDALAIAMAEANAAAMAKVDVRTNLDVRALAAAMARANAVAIAQAMQDVVVHCHCDHPGDRRRLHPGIVTRTQPTRAGSPDNWMRQFEAMANQFDRTGNEPGGSVQQGEASGVGRGRAVGFAGGPVRVGRP